MVSPSAFSFGGLEVSVCGPHGDHSERSTPWWTLHGGWSLMICASGATAAQEGTGAGLATALLRDSRTQGHSRCHLPNQYTDKQNPQVPLCKAPLRDTLT